MENKDYPLISCLCVPQANLQFLQRSIACFLAQTYPKKELVIVFDGNNMAIKKMGISNVYPNVFFCGLNDLQVHTADSMASHALEKAKGDYICLWADSDWHHIARLEYQYEALKISGISACVLNYIILFDNSACKAYISLKRLWGITLLCKINVLKNNYGKDYFFGDDLTDLIESQKRDKKLYLINDVPNLYVHFYCGKKIIWGNYDWGHISGQSHELEPLDSENLKSVLINNDSTEKNALVIDRVLGNPLFEQEEELNGHVKIPKIIHLTYKNKAIPKKFQRTFDSIKKLHPSWDIRIYDDKDAEKLVVDYFPEILDIYKAYRCNIQRVDVFRILIVYLRGGFYLDLDMYCFKSLDELCHLDLILAEEIKYSKPEKLLLNFEGDIQVANYMFGSTPKHPFWIEVLMEIIKRADGKVDTEIDVLKTTGPGMLSHVYHNTGHKYEEIKLLRNKFKRCHKGCPAVSCHFGDFAAHLHVNSWTWNNKTNPLPNIKNNNITEYAKHQALQTMFERLPKT